MLMDLDSAIFDKTSLVSYSYNKCQVFHFSLLYDDENLITVSFLVIRHIVFPEKFMFSVKKYCQVRVCLIGEYFRETKFLILVVISILSYYEGQAMLVTDLALYLCAQNPMYNTYMNIFLK